MKPSGEAGTSLPPGFDDMLDLQPHHQDLEFYDRFFRPGAYLGTHAEHMTRWHPDR